MALLNVTINSSKKRKKKTEFAKKIIAVVMIVYCLASLYGGIIVWRAPQYIGEWLTLVGLPVPAAIGFYCWKARGENIAKTEANPEYLRNDTEVQG